MRSFSKVTGPAVKVGAKRTVPVADRAPEPLPLWALGLLGVVAAVMLVGAVWSAEHLHPDRLLRTVALFVHLVSLVVGLGAVMAVDWFAMLWLLGRRSLGDVARVGNATHTLIWIGLTGLILSGTVLRPDLSNPLTWIKLGLVLLVMLNGLHAYSVGERLVRLQFDNPPRRMLRRAGIAAIVSQLGWWGATLIGFVNTVGPVP